MEGYVKSSGRRGQPPSSPSGSSPIGQALPLAGLHHYQPSLAELQQQQQNHLIMQHQLMQHFYPPPSSSSPQTTVAGMAALLPRGAASPWGLVLPPAIDMRPLPPAPPPSFRSTSVSASTSPTLPSPPASSSSSASLELDVDAGSTTPSPRASKQQKRSSGSRERCGLCDESWAREARDGSACYPDRDGALLPKCPKCNKISYGGLCYVVETESRQGELPEKRGRLHTESLPHVVYQPAVTPSPAQHLTDAFVHTIRRGKAVLAIYPGSTGDTNLGREYLLFPEKRAEIMERVELVQGLEMLRDLLCEDRFFVLHYKYDPSALVLPCLVKRQGGALALPAECGLLDHDDIDAVRSTEVSDIQIGLLVRRGTNKLYNQRVLGLNHQNTLNARLDVYVTKQTLWDRMGTERHEKLKYIQQLVEDEFLLLFKRWNLMGVQQEKEEAQAKGSGSSSSSSSPSSSTSSSASSPSSRLSPPQHAASSPPSPMTPAPSPSSARRGDEPSSPVSPSDAVSSSSSSSASSSSPYVQASPFGKKRRYYPLCLIGQRDVFRIQLVPVSTPMSLTWNGITRRVTKTQWYFPREREPENFNPRIFTYNPAVAAPPPGGKPAADKSPKAKHKPARDRDSRTANGGEATMGDDDDDYLADLDDEAGDSDDERIPPARSQVGSVEVGYPVGVTTYTGFFTDAELRKIEEGADATDADARNGKYDEVPNTYQCTRKGDRLCRTKFFFSARYLWTAEQMASPNSTQAQGIRADVAEPPFWMRQLIERPLVESKIVQEAWVNEFAMNIYHDGTEGLGQHYDDKKRFKRPIYTLRIFSDSRLSFGSKDFSMTNSVFFIPMPRGCITVLEKRGYAVDGIKHCVRAADMGGKSGVVLLRQIHPHLIKEAKEMQRSHAMTRWLSSLDLEDPQQYVKAFIKEELDMVSVRYLQECDLKTLGISKMGPRKVVMQAIYKLRERDAVTMAPHSCCCQCAADHHPGGTAQAMLAPRASNASGRQSSTITTAKTATATDDAAELTPRTRPSSTSTSSKSRSPGREKSPAGKGDRPSKGSTTPVKAKPSSSSSSSSMTATSTPKSPPTPSTPSAATSTEIYATPPSHVRSRSTPKMGGRIKRIRADARPPSPPSSPESSPTTSPLSSPTLGFEHPALVSPFHPFPLSALPSPLSMSSSSSLSSPTVSTSTSASGAPPSPSTMSSSLAHQLLPLPLFSRGSLMIPSAAAMHATATAATKRPLPSDGVPFTVTPILPRPSSPSVAAAATPPPAKRSKQKKDGPTPSQSSQTSSASSSAWQPSRPPLMPLAVQPSPNAANIYPPDMLLMKVPPKIIMMGPPPPAPTNPSASAAAPVCSPAWSPARQLENQLLAATAAPPQPYSPPPAASSAAAPRQRILRVQP